MSTTQLPAGCFVTLEKPALQAILDQLKAMGYRVIGPTLSQAAVVYADLESVTQMPIGLADEQECGRYRLNRTGENSYFAYVVGPHSLKQFLFPPRTPLLETIRYKGKWVAQAPPPPPKPFAFVGVRGCDLHALRVLDRVFLEGSYPDTDYHARRANAFLLAVNCGRAAATCFCTSMGTGPAVGPGADLGLFELPDRFVIEVCTDRGGEVVAAAPWRPSTTREVAEAEHLPRKAERDMPRKLDPRGLRDLLLGQLESDRWDAIADRCLACANCTMVCPTCFCSTVEDHSSIDGTATRRERVWGSCFTEEHSYMNSGTIRKATRARYRQWLTHKLATWIDQFGTSGCVGCGRCITWCPVGIDLTAEVAAIRGASS
ncbi:MAG: 4Fe-4S dicluster domain-containing protein [Gemmataceae bacterium]